MSGIIERLTAALADRDRMGRELGAGGIFQHPHNLPLFDSGKLQP